MARDVKVLHCEPGRGWVETTLDEVGRDRACADLADIDRQLKELTEDDDGARGKLTMRRRQVHALIAQECMVEFGRASVTEVKEGDRNAKVELRPDHLNDPIHGFLDMSDPALWGALQAVRSAGGRCRYRIVVRRQPTVDLRLPWDKVPDKKRIRDLVSIEVLAADGSSAAPPAPAAPPATEVAPPPDRHLHAVDAAADRIPTADGEWWPQNPTGELTCPLCGKSTFGHQILKHAPTGRFAHKTPCMEEWEKLGRPAAPAGPRPTRGSAVTPSMMERLTQPTSTGEALPLAPLATPTAPPAQPAPARSLGGNIDASLALLDIAHADLLRRLGRNPSVAQVKGLASCLQAAVDQATKGLRPGAEPDAPLASRVREAVRVALGGMPPPANPAERQVWVDALATYAAQLVRAAVELAVVV